MISEKRTADGRPRVLPDRCLHRGGMGAFPAVERYGLIWTCLGDPLNGPAA